MTRYGQKTNSIWIRSLRVHNSTPQPQRRNQFLNLFMNRQNPITISAHVGYLPLTPKEQLVRVRAIMGIVNILCANSNENPHIRNVRGLLSIAVNVVNCCVNSAPPPPRRRTDDRSRNSRSNHTGKTNRIGSIRNYTTISVD